MAEPLKFSLPAGAQYFTPFAALPVELRLQIWEDAIYDPGMNFLRVAYDPAPRLSGQGHGTAPPLRRATLAPMYPHPKAEDSHFNHLNSVLDNLYRACAESRRVVQRLINHPSTVNLVDGRVVTPRDAHDVVCLDYISDDLFTSGCRILTDVNCQGLDRIRNVAIRYCHKWETKGPYCEHCGRVHSADSKKTFPLHAYQFLARHMPNLQTVYFIDFLILRKETAEEDQASKTFVPRTSPTFTSKGRKFYEVKKSQQTEWMVSSQVFDVLDWVQENYCRYAVKSTTTRYRHKQPHRVKFKVLSCECDVAPVAVKPKGKCPTGKKGGNKRVYQGEPTGGPSLKACRSLWRQSVHPVCVNADTTIKFIFGKRINFSFTFSVDQQTDAYTRQARRPALPPQSRLEIEIKRRGAL